MATALIFWLIASGVLMLQFFPGDGKGGAVLTKEGGKVQKVGNWRPQPKHGFFNPDVQSFVLIQKQSSYNCNF